MTYADIGGMDIQKQEVREAVELPLTHFDLYKQIGIDPPRGVLMFGPPGCGKTMLAKAVAHHTTGKCLGRKKGEPVCGTGVEGTSHDVQTITMWASVIKRSV